MKLTSTLLITLLLTNVAYAKDINVSVKGMVCGFCAQGIAKKFKSRPEIENVEVSLEKKLVSLKTKNGKDIPDQEIQSILTEAGYNIEKIDRK